MNLGHVEVVYCTLALTATVDGSPVDVGWSVAIVPPRTQPDTTTVWTPVDYADGVATLLLAGPEATAPTGAIQVTADSDLYVMPTGAPPEVLPVLVERITTR